MIQWIQIKKEFYSVLDDFINIVLQEKLLILFFTLNCSLNQKEVNINTILNELKLSKYQLSWVYVVKEEANNIHYHALIGVKTVVEKNDNFKLNILHELKDSLGWDIILVKLNNFVIIKQKFVYILKDSYKSDKNNLQTHNFWVESYLESKVNKFITIVSKFINVQFFINSLLDIGSVNTNPLDNTKLSTYNLIKIYCLYNNLKYKNNFILKKVENSLNSYRQYNAINWIKENFIKIYIDLLNRFPLNLKGVYVEDLLIKNRIYIEEIDLIFKNLPTNVDIKLTFDIIEFNNGFYFFKYNKFISKKYLSNHNIYLNNDIVILKYYNYNYDRKKIPETWIKLVYRAINFDLLKFELICAYLANTIIKNRDIFEKKKVLYIWGKSSTGKTTIIAKPLWHYFGEENVGILSGSKNFTLENLVNKELAILDEYKFNKKRRETDLKLFEGQSILEDVKYSSQQKIKGLNLIVLSNYSINPKDSITIETNKYVDEALFNRTELIQFLKREEIQNPSDLSADIIKKIENENPYILIYCNRVYHKKYVKNKAKTKNKFLIETLLKEDSIILRSTQFLNNIYNVNKF